MNECMTSGGYNLIGYSLITGLLSTEREICIFEASHSFH